MNIIIVIEFIVSSFFYIYNTHSILKFISKNSFYSRIEPISFIIFLTCSFFFIFSKLYYSDSFTVLLAIIYYLLLLICAYLSNKSIGSKISIYTVSLYAVMELVLQSSVYLCFESLLMVYNQKLIMNSISAIINLLAYITIKLKLSDKNSFVVDINTIPSAIYVLILISLMAAGCLLENQLITVDPSAENLNRYVTKIFSVICIPTLILIIISLIFNSITKSYYKSLSSLLEKQIDIQLSYYDKLDKKNEELKKFRHDFRNHMLCLQALINGNDISLATEYIKKITQKDYVKPNRYFTGNSIADAILEDKSEFAKRSDILIEFQGEISDNISPSDICVILSNAIDNAIEACEKISDGDTVIEIRCIFSKNVQIIRISNPVCSEVEIENGLIKTSKQDGNCHGFGLYNIKETIKKYHGNFEIKMENEFFILEVGFTLQEGSEF